MKTYDELFALITQRGVHEVFGAYGEGWGIEQNAAELTEFLVHMQQLGIESVLEIGTGYKAGLARFLHDDMGWEVVSVDIQNYGHAFGGITFISDTIAGFEYPVFQERFDLVIIDGDHTYDAVSFDHAYYAPYAAKVIAFHDIAGLRDCEGVKRYWQEISYAATVSPGYHEIIADTPERGGIGYLVLAEILLDAHKREVLSTPPAKPKPTPRKRAPAKAKTAPKPKAVKK